MNMICQRCKKNPASFFYEENVNGQKKKYVLCAECADELRQSGELRMNFGASPLSLFGDGDDSLFSGLFGGYALPTVQPRAKRCELCGLRFSDIVNAGKVGCPQCYRTFADELSPTLFGIHGSAVHRGRRPHRLQTEGTGAENTAENATHTAAEAGANGENIAQTPAGSAQNDEVATLRAQLKQAIAEEAFERAAELRDQIKKAEGGN